MIKCLLTELGRAGRENIWHSVMAHGPCCTRSVRHDLRPNIFPSGPPTQSISTYYDQLPVIGQLVEHCIAEVRVQIPFRPEYFRSHSAAV